MSSYLYLQVINYKANLKRGEISREVQENCDSYRIRKTSCLYAYVTEGNVKMKENFLLSPLPTMIEYERHKYMLFTRCLGDDPGPITYIYSLEHNRAIASVPAAEAFVEFEPRSFGGT